MNNDKKDLTRIGFILCWGTLILMLVVLVKLSGAYLISGYNAQYNGISTDTEAYIRYPEATAYLPYTVSPHRESSFTSIETEAVCNEVERYSSEDLVWLSAIINAEARGEPLEGKLAVGTVVMNRLESDMYPDSVKDVILDCRYGVQFAPVANGSIYLSPTDESIIAAKLCLDGFRTHPDILFFYNPAISESTYFKENRTYEFTIGNHEFYS